MLLLRWGYYDSFGRPHNGLGYVPPVMEHSHARAVLGYEPTVALEEGLQRTFAWYRATQAAKTAAKP